MTACSSISPSNAWSTAAHGVLAVLWVLAFVLMVFGQPRPAVIPAVAGSTGSVILLASSVHSHLGSPPMLETLLAVEVTLLALVPTLALMVSSTRRPSTPGRRSPLWLIAGAGMAAAFSMLGTGVGVGRSGRQLSFPPSGALVTALSATCVIGLVVMLAASPFDPRLGVAMIALALPIVVYQVLMSVESREAWPAVLAVFALAGAALIAVSSGRSLRRLRA